MLSLSDLTHLGYNIIILFHPKNVNILFINQPFFIIICLAYFLFVFLLKILPAIYRMIPAVCEYILLFFESVKTDIVFSFTVQVVFVYCHGLYTDPPFLACLVTILIMYFADSRSGEKYARKYACFENIFGRFGKEKAA